MLLFNGTYKLAVSKWAVELQGTVLKFVAKGGLGETVGGPPEAVAQHACHLLFSLSPPCSPASFSATLFSVFGRTQPPWPLPQEEMIMS